MLLGELSFSRLEKARSDVAHLSRSHTGFYIRPLQQNMFVFHIAVTEHVAHAIVRRVVEMLGKATKLARLLAFENEQKWEKKYSCERSLSSHAFRD